jgi:hypothetical protein
MDIEDSFIFFVRFLGKWVGSIKPGIGDGILPSGLIGIFNDV